ncbi:MAG: NPCBM/NEW2 domain-containing protein [Terricaulis sp.]
MQKRSVAKQAGHIALAALALCLAASCAAPEAPSDPLAPSGRFSIHETEAAQTPPMGWNPWNAFRTDVDEAKIRGSAQALVASGLAARGYTYVNIDDGWSLQRLANGDLRIRESMFPSATVAGSATGSMRPFVGYIHSLGLKAGLYTDIGRNTCAQYHDAHSPNLPVGTIDEREVGSFEHAEQDMRTIFRDWDFDYVKIDACGVADYGPTSRAVVSGDYREFPTYIVRGDIPASNPRAVEALYATLGAQIRQWGGADAVFSICTWGEALSPRWAHARGNLWRTSPDIEFTWESMLRNIDSAVDAALYAGPGRWNDPDMLAIGHGDFDEHHLTEARAHFSMWAIMSAPLLLGYDLRNSPQSLIDIVDNAEVIAIDQDPAGNQGVPVRAGDTMVIVKTLAASGARAVVFFNRGESAREASVTWSELRFAPGSAANVRDLWRHRDLASARDRIAVQLAAHEAIMLRVEGTPADARISYLDEMPARINVAVDGLGDAALPAGWTPARIGVAPDGAPLSLGGETIAKGIGLFANSRLEIRADGQFQRFIATPAVLNGASPVRFQIYADRRLVQDATITPGGAATAIEADLSGASILELVATATQGEGLPPMIAWSNARLER